MVGVLDGRYDRWMKLNTVQGVAAADSLCNRAWYFEKQSSFDGTKEQKSDGKQYFKPGDTLELKLDRTGPTGVLSLTVHDSVVAQIKGLPSDVALFPAVAISKKDCRCSFTISEAGLGQYAGECQDGRKCGSISLDLAAAPSPATESPDRDPSTYYGCRVQVKSSWCALKGKCGRILSVASPAAGAPTSKQGPRDQLRRDAVGRIVVEDGGVRMHALGNAPMGRSQALRLQISNLARSQSTRRSGKQRKRLARLREEAERLKQAGTKIVRAVRTWMRSLTYMCEFRVDGKLQVVPVKARNLSWLPGKPSNSPLPDQTCDGPGQADGNDAIAGQNSNAGQGGTESPWQVGALVRLLDTPSSGSSALAPGRGARSIGCISAVHLEDSKVSVCVFADAESCLSDCGDVKIGAEVRLAIGYAAVQDASKGPLVAGQKGSVKALQDGLVLVESIGQDNVKALWWYEPEALVLASTFSKATGFSDVVRTVGLGQGCGPGQLKNPFGMAVDKTGNIVVADFGNQRVQVFNAAGDLVRTVGEGQLQGPHGVAVDAVGNLVVVDSKNHRVQVFNAAGDVVRTVGRGEGSGEGQLKTPTGVVVDKTGNIVVADYGNHRVQVFNAAGDVVRTVGRGEGSGEGQLKNPVGVAVDAAGNIVVVDYGNHRVQVFNAAGDVVRTVGREGSGEGELKYPTYVAVDAAGNLIVMSRDNHRVEMFNAAGEVVRTVGRGEGSGEGKLQAPQGVAVDAAGNLVVADHGNHRVQVFVRNENVTTA